MNNQIRHFYIDLLNGHLRDIYVGLKQPEYRIFFQDRSGNERFIAPERNK